MNPAGIGKPTREAWQAAYAVLLLVIVPLAIILNALFVIDRFRATSDAGSQQTALLAARMIAAEASNARADDAMLRLRIATLAEEVPEARALDVLRRENGGYVVVASTRGTDIGMIVRGMRYDRALELGTMLVARTPALRTVADSTPITAAERRSGERYWNVVLLIPGTEDRPLLLAASFAFVDVDALVRESAYRSAVWLVVTALAAAVALTSATRVFRHVELRRKIREADRMKDDFISVASHELRAPITAIRGYLSLFLEDAFGRMDEKPRKALETTFAVSTHLAELVEDIIDVARIEQGRCAVSPAEIDPTRIIEETLERFRFEAEKRGLAFAFERGDTPLPMVIADAARLRQALANLCSNAIKYTPKGSVTLTAEPVPGGMLAIRVTDTGIGMSSADQERLFRKFERVKSDRTAGIPGTGLGLWITKHVVEAMHGRVTVDSIDRVGTQATLFVPIAPSASSPAASASTSH